MKLTDDQVQAIHEYQELCRQELKAAQGTRFAELCATMLARAEKMLPRPKGERPS